MAELVSFTVPTESDKTLLVWELSSGPTAEALHVSRARREGGRETPPPPRDWESESGLEHLARLVVSAERNLSSRGELCSLSPDRFLRGNSQQPAHVAF